MSRWNFLLKALVFAALPLAGYAAEHNSELPVLLVVEVPDGTGGDGITVQFTMKDLMALPAVSFETATLGIADAQQFKGVPVTELMEHVGVTEGTLEVSAIDDYAIELELSTAGKGRATIAYEQNGAPISRRNKGPLRIVYPYDTFSPLERDLFFTYSIWQVERIVVTPKTN